MDTDLPATGSSGGYKESAGLVLGPDQQVNTRTAHRGLLPPTASGHHLGGAVGGQLSIWLSGERRQIWAQSHRVTSGGLQTSEWSAQMMPSFLILGEELKILYTPGRGGPTLQAKTLNKCPDENTWLPGPFKHWSDRWASLLRII